LRIIRGSRRGKQLHPPAGLPVRPTTDMAKESLFNILDNNFYFENISVLDLFSGTGSIAYEFASRGAIEVVAVEMNPKCADYIRQTAKDLTFDNLMLIKGNVFSYLNSSRRQFDVIFADPPYDLDGVTTIPDLIIKGGFLAPDGMFVLEHGERMNFKDHPNFLEQRHYGKVNFTLFSPNPIKDDEQSV